MRLGIWVLLVMRVEPRGEGGLQSGEAAAAAKEEQRAKLFGGVLGVLNQIPLRAASAVRARNIGNLLRTSSLSPTIQNPIVMRMSKEK